MATRGRRRPRFEPSMATRGRRRPQRANSAQGPGRPRITTPSQNRKRGRGWHTNREGWRAILVSHLAIWCSNPNRFEPTGCAPSSSNNTELLLRCCTVALLCCAALLCCHCRHRPRVTTPSCYCGAVLLRCCAVLHCCVLSGGLFELQH